MSHKHNWQTNYITINFADHASGMICNCGKTLTQDEVEDIVNKHLETFIEEGILKLGEPVVGDMSLFPSDAPKEKIVPGPINISFGSSQINEADILKIRNVLFEALRE